MKAVDEEVLAVMARFLEVCQASYTKGDISFDTYRSLTEAKINFVEDILKRESQNHISDSSICTKLTSAIECNRNIFMTD